MTGLLVLLSTLAFLGGPSAVEERLEPAPSQEKSGGPLPGVGLTPREVARHPSPNGELVTYVLRADGLPQDKMYFLTARRMDGSSNQSPEPLHIDGSGRVLKKDGTELECSMATMFAGEFMVFTLASEDGTAKASVEITPFPLEAVGEGGCRLSVRPMSAKGDSFLISGKGFRPDQQIKSTSTSSGEVGDSKVKTKADGSLTMIIFPAVVGMSGGEASFAASDTSCSVTVHYSWGDLMKRRAPSGTAATSAAPQSQATDGAASAAAGQPQPTTGDRFEVANAAYARGDYATALRLLRDLANEGSARAEAGLGDMYRNGRGVPRDFLEASRWYRKAAEQGNATAQLDLGAMYESGLGVPKDPAEAVRWYRKAADQGDPAGQRYLGDMYAKGLGVPKDPKEAKIWYRKAAAQGDPEAARLMTTAQDMGELGMRAVGLLDDIVAVRFLVAHPGTNVTLGTENVTQENANEVLARLEGQQKTLSDAIDQLGSRSVAGDYALRPATKNPCKDSTDRPPDAAAPVSVSQTGHVVEVKGQGLAGCGVVVGNLVVLKAQGCDGMSPGRIVAVATDGGIKDLTFLSDAHAATGCGIGNLVRRSAEKQ